jgi:hypothetical protein
MCIYTYTLEFDDTEERVESLKSIFVDFGILTPNMCVCVYILTHICIPKYVCRFRHTEIHIYTHTTMHRNTYTCTYMHSHTYIHIFIYVYI